LEVFRAQRFGQTTRTQIPVFSIGQVEIGGTALKICEKRRNNRRNRISFVPPFYGFLRLLGKNNFARRANPAAGRRISSGIP
jgi:hypothetical protein